LANPCLKGRGADAKQTERSSRFWVCAFGAALRASARHPRLAALSKNKSARSVHQDTCGSTKSKTKENTGADEVDFVSAGVVRDAVRARRRDAARIHPVARARGSRAFDVVRLVRAFNVFNVARLTRAFKK